MFSLDFSAKRLCFWTLIWSGLLGRPNAESPAQTVKSTITITTTVLYEPPLISGNSQYMLMGCYSQLSTKAGHIFGSDDYNACPDKVAPGNLTIDGCLQGCGSAVPPENGIGIYMYAGLRNGSECRCGVQLSTDAHKLSANDCIIPCSGDPRQSCGGHDNVAVYSLISAGSSHSSKNGGLSALANSQAQQPTTIRPSVSSSTIDTESTALPASAGPGAPRKPVSAPTIAAITGSLSGAIIVSAVLLLCYQVYRRKKRVQDAHVKSMLERRGRRSIQSPMFPSPTIQSDTTDATTARRERDNNEDGGGNASSGIDDHEKDLRLTVDIPNTPAVESGGKQAAGASSAVQWGPNNSQSSIYSTQFTSHRRTASSNGVAPPPPSAAIDGLGERAWHRRKLSTPYHPPVVVGSGIGRGNIARAGPPSGPPARPLPPTPPSETGARARPRSRSGVMPDTLGYIEETGRIHPPPRPRRSFDTIQFEPELGDHDELYLHATSGGDALGMSHANMSTPSLGRYGSISKPRRPIVESPVLGWQAANGLRQWGVLPHETTAESSMGGQPRLVLPPVAPGERFDHKRWRGTIYAEPYESIDSAVRREKGRGQGRGDEPSPVSVSSVGTSILFGLEELDREL
ncbi:hypothetical protein ANO14919_144450 [Xylariales sp. No.14919]|nr:hypothetical protein ANO14919_144450 [Xylariales sp. No.14919]